MTGGARIAHVPESVLDELPGGISLPVTHGSDFSADWKERQLTRPTGTGRSTIPLVPLLPTPPRRHPQFEAPVDEPPRQPEDPRDHQTRHAELREDKNQLAHVHSMGKLLVDERPLTAF